MNIECYACGQKPGLRPKKIMEEGDFKDGACWGICKVCGLVICSGHGRRKENPYEYQCVYCTGDFIERGGFNPQDPSDPTPEPGDLDDLADAISNLKHDIVKAVKDAVIEYLKANDKRKDSPLDKEALVIAAKAFRKAAEIPEPTKRRDLVEV
jgi:hypothetical protein